MVYNTEAPLDWDFKAFNKIESPKMIHHLKATDNVKMFVPYNENRVVVFHSNLIHETDKFEFKEGYENRRINITMLFGKREL